VFQTGPPLMDEYMKKTKKIGKNSYNLLNEVVKFTLGHNFFSYEIVIFLQIKWYTSKSTSLNVEIARSYIVNCD
jgi:hypothetical protein